jgi:hypothetical protein
LDDTSTISSLGELVTGVQTTFEQLIACSDVTPEGSCITESETMANALHSLTDLFEAIDAREEGKTPSPETSNASFQQVFDRLGATEKQIQHIQSEHNRNTRELQAPRVTVTPAAPGEEVCWAADRYL